jgi:SAM-dependent methyltransferase
LSRTNPLDDPMVAHHYHVEVALADRLRNSTKAQRTELYTAVYEELFREVPYHVQLTNKDDLDHRDEMIRELMDTLAPYLTSETIYAEIGSGDCALTMQVAPLVRKAWGIDVSPTVIQGASAPNMELVLSDGVSIPVEATLIFSNQLMEHLHPDDAREQLENVFKALLPGGRYLCITPNRLNGPHDVSRGVDAVARGFHLHEYTYVELDRLFKDVGFTRTRALIRVRGRQFEAPTWLVVTSERAITALPGRLRHRVASLPVVRRLLDVMLIGIRD